MNGIDFLLLKKRIQDALEEDIQTGDVTTLATIPNNQASEAVLIAKSDGVFCGKDVADLVLQYFDSELSFHWSVKDGDVVSNKQVLGSFTGNTRILLQAERTLLNLLQRMSGIATATYSYSSKIKHTPCKVLDTRKTMPLWRDIDKYSVVCGGGINHRIGLYDMVLIKDNHIAAAGSITQAVQSVFEYFKTENIKVPIEVEVKNTTELQEVLKLNDITRILLDNMTTKQLKECVGIVNGRVALEASGNINLETIVPIAETGVDFASVGSLTHSVKAMDISLLIT